MNLVDLIDNTKSDKNTVHSYLDTYQNLFKNKKETAKDVLEIGIYHGGSIKLWNDYFLNAKIHGIDIMNIDRISSHIKNNDNIILYTSTDAYNENTFNEKFLNKKFDIIIEDGNHKLDSLKIFLKLYIKILKDDGILIIEDIQEFDWIDKLKEIVPEELKKYIEIYDLRKNKDRYDDILFVINKNI